MVSVPKNRRNSVESHDRGKCFILNDFVTFVNFCSKVFVFQSWSKLAGVSSIT